MNLKKPLNYIRRIDEEILFAIRGLVTSNNSVSYTNCSYTWHIMLVDGLRDRLGKDSTLPIYVQVGHNRFPIDDVHHCGDYMLIAVGLDADNPEDKII